MTRNDALVSKNDQLQERARVLDIETINEALERLTSLSNIVMGASLVNDGAAIRRAALEMDEHIATIHEQVNANEDASDVSQAAK